jgi:hypothetical protein
MSRIIRPFVFLLLITAISSCDSGSKRTAILWTDQPEFAFYAEFFNANQNQYKIETHYFDFPSQKLKEDRARPDIVTGSWLKSVPARFFKPLDKQFMGDSQFHDAFYPRLLAMGNMDGKQYLLPVSFKVPAVIFAQGKGEQLSNPFTVDLKKKKKLGEDYNVKSRGVYTHMGFSPSWDNNFLFLTATLLNASFREADPLAWDIAALDKAMTFAYDWVQEANSGFQAVDDFTFK